jgi:hypothetical protein
MQLSRPSHATVVAYVALFVALGGSAYAVSKIGSEDIANNSIRSKDLRNDSAVAGRDVRDDTLTGHEIREKSLDVSELISVSADGGGVCDPAGPTLTPCVEDAIALKRASTLLLIGTGGFFSQGQPARSLCELRADGQTIGAATPGETAINTDSGASDGFAITGFSPPLAKGAHTITLECNQVLGDARIAQPTIAAIAVGAER